MLKLAFRYYRIIGFFYYHLHVLFSSTYFEQHYVITLLPKGTHFMIIDYDNILLIFL